MPAAMHFHLHTRAMLVEPSVDDVGVAAGGIGAFDDGDDLACRPHQVFEQGNGGPVAIASADSVICSALAAASASGS